MAELQAMLNKNSYLANSYFLNQQQKNAFS